MADLLDRLAAERFQRQRDGDEIANLLDEAIVEIEKLRAFVGAVAAMRVSQKAYFKDKKQSDLIASKKGERDVDDRLTRIQRGEVHQAEPAQAKLL